MLPFPSASIPPNAPFNNPLEQTSFYRRRSPQQFIFESPYVASIGRAIAAYAVGYPMGIFLALLVPPSDIDKRGLPKGASSLRLAIHGMKQTVHQGISNGGAFAKMGFYFTASECFLEIVTGRSTMIHSMISGFVTGAIIALGSGPQAVVVSGLGFMTFAAAIDVAFGTRSPKPLMQM